MKQLSSKITRPATQIPCEQCGTLFLKENRYIKREKHHFCSISCSTKHAHITGKFPQVNYEHLKQMSILSQRRAVQNRKIDPFKWYIRRIKTRQHQKYNLNIDFTTQDLQNLWENQQGKCALTGIDLHLHIENDPDQLTVASIDRIDSGKGYFKDNIQFVALPLNYAKNDFTNEQMVDFIRLIRQ